MWKRILYLVVTLTGVVYIASCHSFQPSQPIEIQSDSSLVYLPFISKTDDFYLNQPIWASESQLQPHEVVLFRATFDFHQTLAQVEMQLFADTRYQLWLDGVWVGRGPARFARTYRQYDVFPLSGMAPGEHTLAVLVQWSPDDRRSESIRPLLQAAFKGNLPDGSHFVLRTDPAWKALVSPAWRGDAAMIHQWGLIGYSELLDLSQLPEDWNQPGFLDGDWPQAVVVDPNQQAASFNALPGNIQSAEPIWIGESMTEPQDPIRYGPRDIAFQINQAIPVHLIDSGTLLPGRAIGELPAGTAAPYDLPFSANADTVFTIETLGAGVPPPDSLILLDGASPIWQLAGSLRPDVYLAHTELIAGPHSLTFNPPPEGLTFTLSTSDLSGLSLPFQQGNHAGRRLLLAEPASQPGVVIVNPGDVDTLEFINLPAYVVLDLGRVTHGRITAQVSGPAGTVIDIGWDERLLEGTLRPLPYPGSLHALWNQTDSWILDGTSRQLTTIDARSGRYILIAVWGNGTVRLDSLVVSSEHYPLIPVGDFQSSDPLLNQIWQIGVDTARLNMVDAYMDPWRERGQWWGDSFVIDQVNQVAFGDASLLRRGLLFMHNAFPETQAPGCAPHNNNLHMLDYAMLWVHSLSDYLQRTGDLTILRETYLTLQQFIQHLESFENPETNLLDLPKTTWAETAYIDTLGYSSRYGQSAALNAMYYAALLKAAEIAGQVGDAASQDLWQWRAENVRSSLNTWLYLPEQGRYITNIYEGVAYKPTLYAQAWPLAYGLVPESEQGRVASALLELLSPDPQTPNIGTYGFYWILEGLAKAGYMDQALVVMKSYYGRMIERGATTWWENFLADQNFSNALSHGWGSSPTWFLTTYVLGASQVAPDEWALAPAIHSLNDAAGTLPLPQGALHISYQKSSCTSSTASFITHLEVSSPNGTHGRMILTLDPVMQWVTLNGQRVWSVNEGFTSPSIKLLIPLEAGSHGIDISSVCPPLP